jgi:uncharacterized protein YfaS (alpha-2-macroglobulin family)
MKHIITALSILMGITFSNFNNNSYDYEKAWKEVEKHISDGLPKSALEKVEEIYQSAISEKNDPQLAKTMIYLSRLTIQTDEKGIENMIARYEKFIKDNNGPAKYITASYLAELYQNYFDNHRWEISQRSELTSDKSEDFRTWSTQQFLSTIQKWYLYSIENKKEINISVDDYKTVMEKYDREGLKFRPKLYEVLANRAFDFFKNYDNYSSENQESFQIDQEWHFANVEKFTANELKAADKNSAKLRVLELYQDVLKTQLQNKNDYALADYDLMRIEYVYKESQLENKLELLTKALEDMVKRYSNIDFSTNIMSKLAYSYQASDSLGNIKALKICEDAIRKFPNSDGAAQCQNIIKTIKNPYIQMYGEQVYPSKNQLLVAFDYNNVTQATIETVKLDNNMFIQDQSKSQEINKQYLLGLKKLNSQKISLKASPSLKVQKQEITLPELPYGQYALLMRAKNNEKDKEIFQYLVFYISDLAYTTYASGNKRVYIVSDRMSGKPLSGVKVSLHQQNYNPSNRKLEFVRTGEYLSDSKGRVKVNDLAGRNNKVILTNNLDVLDLNHFHYNYATNENTSYSFAEFYTDRSIYRPGQVIYYKTLLLRNDNNQIPSILPNKTVEITFRDANYQEIARQTLTSNEFGSIHGSFTIPTGRLNGAFSLSLQSNEGIQGQKSIQVEEYKRPTFEVINAPVIGEYKLHEKVKVTGSAQTLAGSPVDGAKVMYKVVRSARFPDWGWWWRIPMQSSEFILAIGETVTDGEGKYEISFDAIPDPKIPSKNQPVFTYHVTVDVTDQRGETRSAESNVSIAYTAFSLSTNLPEEVDIDQLKPVWITATNTNGQKVDAKGKLKIFILKEPKSVQINKYWTGKTDIHPLKSVLEKYLPQYPLSTENDFTSWPIASQVFNTDFTTRDSLDIKSKLQAGVYKLELESTDKNGVSVTAIQYVVITNFSKSIFPKSDFLFVESGKTTLEPGEKLQFQFGASDKPIFIHAFIEKDGKILSEQTLHANKNAQWSFPITEEHRGGVNINFAYIINNRNYTKSYHVMVPWTNKQLDISFESFRDKTLPGSIEEYKIKIKGPKRDQVVAEMVAAMYDASLDQFMPHSWRSAFYPDSYAQIQIEIPGFNLTTGRYYVFEMNNQSNEKHVQLPALIPLIDYFRNGGDMVMMKSRSMGAPAEMMIDVPRTAEPQAAEAKTSNAAYNQPKEDAKSINKQEMAEIPLRKNLKETVFFFPELKTDKDGNIILSYTINEALTKWKLLSFAHSKDFKTGYDERTVQTQKNLMIFPNAPRFVRDGDKISISAKVSNLTDSKLNGSASLVLYDAINLKDITSEILNSKGSQSFTVEKGRSEALSWELTIPETKYQAITYRISAEAGGHIDGEENTIPVLTNRMLVTESMPMWIKGNETKTYTFNAFKNNVSPTKKDYRYTFEYTSNPVWYAIQALPYMASVSNSSTQALVDRFYANVLASKIANAHPKIKSVMDQWQMKDKDALLSNLSKNEELKTAMLEETPWLRQSLSESEQKRNIAILFDLNKMADDKKNIISKLKERQLSNGGFSWFAGGRDDVYITQNILENIGHLYRLGAIDVKDEDLSAIISNGLKYMDEALTERYEKLKSHISQHGGDINADHLDDLSVHYLYIRTFFKHVRPIASAGNARDYYFGQAKKYWLSRGLYSQAMIGLILHRNDDATVAKIVKSLREKSFSSEELGMYWNEGNGFYWYQLPVERHSLLLELFSEVENNKTDTDRMKIWLLKNKQTNHWKTSKSTAAAIYALLLQGENANISQWVTESVEPVITIGKETLKWETSNPEAGTGYIKKTYINEVFNKDMATIKLVNKNKSVAWGATYYQYFEQLDKITNFAETPLSINKKLYKVLATDKGNKSDEITASTALKPGDKVKVRIEIRADRSMEYIHLKDMRASCFEPVNVISEYKYQGQLGYYETTKDVATHFYFNFLPKGTFVFEYDMRVVHKGNFTGGIANIECMYAPEFSSHSEGTRVTVK